MSLNVNWIWTEINEEVVEEQPWLWDDLKYSRELGKLESLLSNTLPADKEAPTIGDWRNNSELEVDEGLLTSSAPRPNEIINNHQQESQHRSKSAQEEADDDDDDEDDEEEEDKMNDVIYEADARSIAATEEKSSSHLPLHKPKPQKRRLFDTRTTHFPVFRYRNGNAQPRVLPLLGSHAALSKIQRESAQFMAKVLRRYGNIIESFPLILVSDFVDCMFTTSSNLPKKKYKHYWSIHDVQYQYQ